MNETKYCLPLVAVYPTGKSATFLFSATINLSQKERGIRSA